MSENISFKKEETQDNYASEKVDVIKNTLLGDYNENGNYVISEKIMNELILINKVKTNSYGNSVFCSATLDKYGEINFEISFKKNSKLNIALAEIYVLESVEKVNGYIYNTVKTPIGKFTEQISDDFVSRSFLMFNVVQNNVGADSNDDSNNDDSVGKEYKEIEEFNAKFIETRMSFLSALSKLTEKDYEKSYENYFNKRIDVLKSQNSLYANTILNTFNHEYSKIEKFFLLDKKGKIKFKTLNELLDKSFEDVNGTKRVFVNDEVKYKQKVENYMKSFVNNVKKYEENATQQIISQTKDEQVKSEIKDVVADRKTNIGSSEGNKIIDVKLSSYTPSFTSGGSSYSLPKDAARTIIAGNSVSDREARVSTVSESVSGAGVVIENNNTNSEQQVETKEVGPALNPDGTIKFVYEDSIYNIAKNIELEGAMADMINNEQGMNPHHNSEPTMGPRQ